MDYQDTIYGCVEISQPLVGAILNSQAMQRLQGVLQHGVSALIGITSPTSRLEHSIGAMLLVRRLGAGLEEQIAALLHDVSHTAFSHVIDYVFDGHESQSYHDEMKAEYVAGTDLPAILAGYGYDWHIFLNESAYSLLEQAAPHLCADRLDYFLRDARDLGLATATEITAALEALHVHNGRIVVTDLEIARWLGETFMAADQASWANFREVGLYELAARAIRRAMQIGVLSEADLWGEDRPAWGKLQASSDPELQHNLQRVHANTQFVWDDANPEFRVATKLRSIDPDVYLDGHTRPLSYLDPSFADLRRSYLTQRQGKWPMRVISPQN